MSPFLILYGKVTETYTVEEKIMATLYVKKDGSGDATTIASAVFLAAPGDTIEIEAGTFDENVNIYKGIHLKGAGIDQTILTGAIRANIPTAQFTWASGSNVLTLATGVTSNYILGRIVTASGIPTGSRVSSISETQITITNNTTAAATTARAVGMPQEDSNLATIVVRGTNGSIKDMKVVGFDGPFPSVEHACIYLRNFDLPGTAANTWEISNVEMQANGEYGLLSDSGSALGNFNINNCIFSGKTFVGDNPAVGNQFSVPNVPRQLVVIQGVNVGVDGLSVSRFENNQVIGITGGLTVDNVQSFNTAVTFDAPKSIISGNEFDGVFGYGFCLRARGLNTSASNNTNITAQNPNNGFYILPNHSNNQVVTVGTMILNSSKYWICIQEHTSSAANAPLGASGASFWQEITLQQVNESGVYGVSLQSIGTNNSINVALINFSQTSAGEPIMFVMSKDLLKTLPKVAQDVLFSVESNWRLVSYIFKKKESAQRLVSAFRDFEAEKSVKLKSGMLSSDEFELHKIIISTPDRTLLVMKRNEIQNASSFDFVLL